MHVMTRYLDTHKAAIKALQDYQFMEAAAQPNQEAAKLKADLTCVSSPAMDGMPHARDPHRGESRIAATLDKIDVLEQRTAQARQYLHWFGTAWDSLSDDDRFVLENFFLGEGSQEEKVRFLGEHFHVERDSVYRKKNRAVERLAVALYWK